MSDEKTANSEQSDSEQNNSDQNKEQAAQNDKQFALQKIYVKDISFETPNSPGVFTEKWEPILALFKQFGTIILISK